jgi:type IV secretory pathway protease TraF
MAVVDDHDGKNEGRSKKSDGLGRALPDVDQKVKNDPDNIYKMPKKTD